MPRNPTLSGEQLVDRLREHGETIIFTGMVKQADSDGEIMFARGTDCQHWITIPREYVERADVLGLVPCHDHDHHLVRLYLKRPQSAEARVFADLAQLHRAAPAVAQGAAARPAAAGDPQSNPCFVVGEAAPCPPGFYRTYDPSSNQYMCCRNPT